MVARGVVPLAFGLVLLAQPMSPVLLAVVFGAVAVIDGVLAFAAGLQAREARRRQWPLYLEGTLGILAGEVALSVAVGFGVGSSAFAGPSDVARALGLLIGVRAIAVGAVHVVSASTLFHNVEARQGLALVGVASLAFGVLLLVRLGRSAAALSALVGLYAVAMGCLLTVVMVAVLHQRARAAPAR